MNTPASAYFSFITDNIDITPQDKLIKVNTLGIQLFFIKSLLKLLKILTMNYYNI